MRRPGIIPIDNRSHVLGETSEEIWDLTIPELLNRTACRREEDIAVVFAEHDIRWSWREFASEVDRLATSLLAIGIGVGDRIGIWSPNSPEWLTVQFASARIGAVLVTINPAYQDQEAEYVLKMVGARAVLLGRKYKSTDYVRMMYSMAPELNHCMPGELQCRALPDLRMCIHMGRGQLTGMLAYGALMESRGSDRSELTRVSAGLDPDDAINIQFTSGTTGSPKGATLTHRNIVNNARFVAETLKLGIDDRLCIPVPLYHCFGMVMGSLACVTSGSGMIFPGAGFDAAGTLHALEVEECTALYGVPTMFVAMLELLETEPRELSSLRTGIMAGAPCPMEIMRRVIAKMNLHQITIAYGMTETSPVSFQSHVDDTVERKVGTVGRIHPHVEVRIVDQSGKVVDVGVQGELHTRGYSVMAGYWNDPGATARAIDDDGWMHTGDLAIMDTEGYCRIVGRLSDMIIRGGENIYPREIEEFIYTHDAVKVVQVFGVPDQVYGEELCAWIITRDDADVTGEDIREFCSGRIAHYKIPRHIRLRDQVPMTVTGKPQKFLMREMMVKELENPL